MLATIKKIGGNQPGYIGANPLGQSLNAYVSRLELNYNDADGLFLGGGG